MKVLIMHINRFKYKLQWNKKGKVKGSARESTFLRRLSTSCFLVQIRTRIMENIHATWKGISTKLLTLLSKLIITSKWNIPDGTT